MSDDSSATKDPVSSNAAGTVRTRAVAVVTVTFLAVLCPAAGCLRLAQRRPQEWFQRRSSHSIDQIVNRDARLGN